MVLVGYGFDPEVDPYFWTSKTTDGFKSITDSDLTALNAKCVASLQEYIMAKAEICQICVIWNTYSPSDPFCKDLN